MSSCLLLVCTVSQSHLHDYQHFADLGTVMVWCGLDGGWGSGDLSVGRLFLKFDYHYLLRLVLNQSLPLSGGFSQATALLALAADDY